MKTKLILISLAATFQFGCASNPTTYTRAEFKKDISINQAPRYPAVSRRRGEQGKVLLKALVTTSGEVSRIEINQSSGYARLDEAALDAVRKWQFYPAKKVANLLRIGHWFR